MKGIQSNPLIPIQGFICYPYPFYEFPFQIPTLQAYKYMQVNKDGIKVKQEVKEEYESEPIKADQCKKKIIKQTPYTYPGETKNFYKNIGKKLASFIENSFDQKFIKQDSGIMQFIKIESKHYNRIHFKKLSSSKLGKIILKEYFGSFQWCSQLIQHNKTDIDLYFRHNQLIFKRKKRIQRTFKA